MDASITSKIRHLILRHQLSRLAPVLDDVEHRLEEKPDAMQIRRSTVEHPFGTIKAWMGATHFLTRTRAKVAAEMSLHVLAYNFKRVLKIIGIGPLMVAIKAI